MKRPDHRHEWRRVRHPLRIVLDRGWRWGARFQSLISPRGTVFAVRGYVGRLFARRHQEFQLNDH